MPRMQRKTSKEANSARWTGHVVIRECIAIAVYHTLFVLLPIILQRAAKFQQQQQGPHPAAVAAISLWWTCRVTGLVPHLVLRMAEHQLGRKKIPPLILLILLHVLGQFTAMCISTREVPDVKIPWRLLAEQLPSDCIRMSVLAVAMLVVPVLLQVNRIVLPGWLLLFLLLIPTHNENGMIPSYQPIIYYVVLHLLSGFITGRWMQWSFPDDPGSRAAMLS